MPKYLCFLTLHDRYIYTLCSFYNYCTCSWTHLALFLDSLTRPRLDIWLPLNYQDVCYFKDCTQIGSVHPVMYVQFCFSSLPFSTLIVCIVSFNFMTGRALLTPLVPVVTTTVLRGISTKN